MSKLYLRTLGPIGLERIDDDGARTAILGPGKPLAVVTYLALSAHRTTTREHLLDVFWADSDSDAARRNLRQIIYSLRRLLGEDALRGHDDILTLAAPLVSDYEELTAAIGAGDAHRVVALSTGPFFPSFATPGSARFEQWADLERLRLQLAQVHALESLVREALAQRRLRDATTLARRLRDTDPEREASRRLLIEASVTAGEWLQAAAEADALERWLNEQGRAPEPATLAMLNAARRAPPAAEGRRPETRLVAEMVGRAAEFAALLTEWDAARSGRLVHVHVSGVAGIGKSRLLRDLAARIAALGGRVVSVRANQGERALPFAVAGDLVRGLATLPGAAAVAPATASILVGLDPALSARYRAAHSHHESGDTLRLRTMAISELIGAVAEEQPIAVFVDDLHWADGESRQIVAGLAARVTAHPVLLVTSARPVADAPSAGRTDENLVLRPLRPAEVEGLVESLGEIPEDLRLAGFPEALCEATDGSPLHVLETLQLALDRGWLARDGDRWVTQDREPLFAQLRSGGAVEARIEALAPMERRLALVLAVAGAPVPTPLLDGAAHRLAFSFEPALAALERLGYAAPRDGTWELVHDVLAERLLGGASPEELREACEALGLAYATAIGGDPARARIAAPLLASAGADEALHRVFRRWERLARSGGDWRPPLDLARDLLGAEHRTKAPGLVRSLPVTRRWRLGAPAVRAAVGAVVVVAVALGAWWGYFASRPHHLVFVQQPSIVTGHQEDLVVLVADRLGRAVHSARDSVRLSVGASDAPASLAGPRAALPHEGRVRFVDLRIDGAAWATLRASYPGLSSIETDTVLVSWAAGSLRIDSVRAGDQLLTGPGEPLVVRPGSAVSAVAYVRATVVAGNSAVVLAAVPTWGDSVLPYVGATALPSNVRHGAVAVSLSFRAPSAAQRAHVIFVAAPETDPVYVVSSSNWAFGQPFWGDGDEVFAWSSEQIAQAAHAGRVRTTALVPRVGVVAGEMAPAERARRIGSAVREPRIVLAAVLTVDVRAP